MQSNPNREYRRDSYFSSITVANIADVERSPLNTRDFHVYLFNDSILLATPGSKSGTIQFYRFFELINVISLKENILNMENTFQIVISECKNGTLDRTSFTLTAKSLKERDDWADDIRELLSELKRSRASPDGLWQIEVVVEKEDVVPTKKEKRRKNKKTLSGGVPTAAMNEITEIAQIKPEVDEIYLRVEIPGANHTLQKTLKFENISTNTVKTVVDTIVEKSPIPIIDKTKYGLYLRTMDNTEVEVLHDLPIIKTFKNMDHVIFKMHSVTTKDTEDQNKDG